MMKALKARWPEGPLRRLPRLYKALFSDVRYRCGDDILNALHSMEQAKRELETADAEAKVSDGILGYLTLQTVQLTDQEVVHVLGLTAFSMAYDKVKAVLLELYPCGSYHVRQQGAPRRGHAQGHVATADGWEEE